MGRWTRFLFCGVLALVFSASLWAAEVGYFDDFSGEQRGWADSSAYQLTQEDGVLTLEVRKQTKWTGQYLNLGGKLDLSGHPYVNLRVKTDTPCLLHVYLADGKNNDLLDRKVRVVDDFVTLVYDFSDAGRVDLKGVEGMIFTVNGAANSWDGTLVFDELRVGDKAVRLAGIDGVPSQIQYRDSGEHTILLTGLDNAASVKVSGAGGLVRNATASPVRAGKAVLSYECVPGATGADTMAVTAVGASGFQDNTVSFGLTVEDNLPPTVDEPEDVVVVVGALKEVRLTGISDGNIAAEQPLKISAGSSDDRVIPGGGVKVAHAPGSPYAALSFKPEGRGEADVTVTLDDGGPGRGATSVTFSVRAVPSWNNPPTIAALPDQSVFCDAGEQRIALTGIGDGDDGKQSLTVTASSSDESVIPSPVQVDYSGGDTAVLRLKPNPSTTGTTTITVTVGDGGGTADNNGDRQVQTSFVATTRVRPLTAFRETFGDWEGAAPAWRPETGIEVSGATLDGGDVLRVDCKDKLTFGGLWLDVPDMDVTQCPYLTVDVRPADTMQFNMYFYDGTGRRNSGASRTTAITGGRWQTVTFDFSGEGQMEDNKGQPVDAGWVKQVLFNFHPKLGWPFNRYSGTLYFRNLRIGTAADVPERKPACTMDEVADRVHLKGAGPQEVRLTGIGSGDGAALKLTVSSSNAAVVPAPKVGSVARDGTAALTYAAGQTPGKSVIQVRAEAAGAEPRTVSFAVEILSDDPSGAVAASIDCSQQHQMIYGFGTFQNDLPVELYAGELGASAMRVGLISNQIEWANDNSDPDVLHRGALDYTAFDFEHLRRLHEAGVETFILTSWSPPAWMKPNMSLNYQGPGAEGSCENTLNRLGYDYYEEYAETMVAAVRMFQEEAGIDLAAIGLQNEPVFHEPYPSAIMDPGRFLEMIKVAGRRFEREGIKTRLFMPEQVFSQTSSMRLYISALTADPEAEKYCDIVATHGYDTTGVRAASPDFPAWSDMWKRSQQGSRPKEMWMTETGLSYSDWDSALGAAVTLYGSLEYGNMGLWTTWSIEGQLVNRAQPNPTFYSCSQFFRNVRPGARRVTSTSSDREVLVTSYVNDADHGGNLVSVLINRSGSAKAVRLNVQGGAVTGRLLVTRTDRVSRGATVGQVAASDLVLLPAKSVTTVIEQ